MGGWNKGKKASPESRLKMSLARRGVPKSLEWRRKMSERQKGNKHWLGKKHSAETKKKMSAWQKGRPFPEHLRGKFQGTAWTTERRLAWSERKKAEGNNNWKGGITSRDRLVRNTWRYRLWSQEVRNRDKRCAKCGATKNLHAHHKLEFSKHIELRFDLENGVTLCAACHYGLHHGKNDLEEWSLSA